MGKKETLTFAGHTVEIDPEFLRFDETTLNQYIQKEAGYYDNFGAYLSLAEKNLQNKEVLHEKLASERFVEAKEAGGSDKLAEAKAKADPDVVVLKEEMVEARYVVNRLKQHLRAWDKNHDNAQSLGHMQRKIMDKLHADIIGRFGLGNTPGQDGLDQAIEDTVQAFNESQKAMEPQDKTDVDFECNLSVNNLF